MDNRKIVIYEDIVRGMKEVGLKEGDHVIVHSSLKSFGFVVGGEEVVIRAIIDVIGDSGTVIMSSQTWKNLDPDKGVHWLEPKEWWPVIRDNWPAYDKSVTPAIGMGAIARMFSVWPGVSRSDHPARSFAAFGKEADFLTNNHDLSNIFGKESPLDKLYSLGGKILLIGVGHNKNTSLHLAETRANFTKKYTTEHSAVLEDGKRVWKSYETLDVDDEDFLLVGQAFQEAFSVKKAWVGNTEFALMNQVELVDFATNWFTKHRE